MSHVVTLDGLDRIADMLRAQDRRVIGPVVRGGVITHDDLGSVRDLPIGWTEEQDGGSYRLVATGTDEAFAFSSPSTSWKSFLYPPRTLMVRSSREKGALKIEQPTPESTPLAFFGIRSCDLAALGILDRVFLDPAATDPTYEARRSDLFIVAVACGNPGATCFCASMDTGPSPRSGYDLSVTELYGDDRHHFLVEAGTDRGAAMLEAVTATPATDNDRAKAAQIHDHAVASMGRRLDAADPPLAALANDHPQWDDVAERCLACGNCTMACPTCFCSSTEDHTNLIGTEAERWRTWDSCFTLDFSYMHGGSARTSTKSRYRQWLLHKLVTWQDQFGSSGCVGCGRCITWCPVGIDLTAEIAALARPAPSQPDPGVGR